MSYTHTAEDYGKSPKKQTIGELLRAVEDGKETVLDLSIDAENGTSQILFGKRDLQPEPRPAPRKTESPRRAHTFFSVPGFVNYLKKYKTDDTVIYCDASAGLVQAIVDERAKEGFEIVSLNPKKHPLWAPWDRAMSVDAISLADLIHFLRKHRRSVVEPDARSLIMALNQVTTSISVEMHQGSGRNSLNGMLIRTKIQGTESEDIVEMPEVLTLSVPMYVGTDPIKIEIDLILNATKDRGVTAKFSSGDVLDAEIKCFAQIQANIATGLKDSKIVIAEGRPDHEPWKYLND